jgi:O-acetyl-ADP-ribose deacetylase (regulator of RNase III)
MGESGEPELLASSYRNSLKLAADNHLKSIAFPCISTGVYGYPFDLAAKVAVTTVRVFIQTPSSLEQIIFCCFSPSDLKIYQTILLES